MVGSVSFLFSLLIGPAGRRPFDSNGCFYSGIGLFYY